MVRGQIRSYVSGRKSNSSRLKLLLQIHLRQAPARASRKSPRTAGIWRKKRRYPPGTIATSPALLAMPKPRRPFFPRIRHWRIVPLSFVEARAFSKIRERYLDDEQIRLLQAALMTSPVAGRVIRGSGGLRKLRWGSDGRGRRGGLRIVY